MQAKTKKTIFSCGIAIILILFISISNGWFESGNIAQASLYTVLAMFCFAICMPFIGMVYGHLEKIEQEEKNLME